MIPQTNKIYQGDCREIMRQWDDECIDMVITSPPYWNSRQYCLFNSKEIGYNQTYKSYLISLQQVWFECCRVLRDGCRLVINIGEIFHHIGKEDYVVYSAIFVDIFKQIQNIKSMRFAGKIIWCKGTNNENSGIKIGKAFYGSYPYPPNLLLTNCQENLMVWRKTGKRTYKDVPGDIAQKSKIDKKFIHQFTRPVWFVEPERNKTHKAVFPMEIPLRFIKAYSFVNDIILDPFGGIGTTGLAAQKLERRYILIDLSPEYVKMAERNLSVSDVARNQKTV